MYWMKNNYDGDELCNSRRIVNDDDSTVEPGLFDTGLFDTLAYPTRFCIPLKLAISTHVFYPGLFDTGLFDTPAYSTPISTPFMKNTLFLPRFIRQLY